MLLETVESIWLIETPKGINSVIQVGALSGISLFEDVAFYCAAFTKTQILCGI